jgi:hypothetical protein
MTAVSIRFTSSAAIRKFSAVSSIVSKSIARVRLALLERQRTRELLPPLVDQVGDRVTHLGALPRRARRPRRLRVSRRFDGGVDVVRTRVGRLRQSLTGDRGDDGAGTVAGRSDPAAGNEVLERTEGKGHGAPFFEDRTTAS